MGEWKARPLDTAMRIPVEGGAERSNESREVSNRRQKGRRRDQVLKRKGLGPIHIEAICASITKGELPSEEGRGKILGYLVVIDGGR